MTSAETEKDGPTRPAPESASLFCPRCQSWDLAIGRDEDALVCRCKTCDTDFIVTNKPLVGFWNL
jgi:hypothetical protein